jgi:hypothetical protein
LFRSAPKRNALNALPLRATITPDVAVTSDRVFARPATHAGGPLAKRGDWRIMQDCRAERPGWDGVAGEESTPAYNRRILILSRSVPENLLRFSHSKFWAAGFQKLGGPVPKIPSPPFSGGGRPKKSGLAMTECMIRSAADWAPFFRARIAELGLSHFEVDQRTGLAEGYTNKILNGKKLPGALTIERLCRELKISLRPVADDETKNSAPKDFGETRQHSDTIDDQRSDLHVEAGTGCSPVGAGVAGKAAGAGGSGPATPRGADPENSSRRDPAKAHRGRGMNDVLERPDTVPMTPPAPTAKAVLAHRKKLEIERDSLKTGAGELALKSAQGDPDAKAALAAIPAKQAWLQFELDQNHSAYELATKQDSDAEAFWRKSLQSMNPADLIAGINRDECCGLCQPGIAGGCVLVAAAPYPGSTCFHPTRFGTFHQFSVDGSGLRIFPFRNNPDASKVFDLACDKLKVRGKFS